IAHWTSSEQWKKAIQRLWDRGPPEWCAFQNADVLRTAWFKDVLICFCNRSKTSGAVFRSSKELSPSLPGSLVVRIRRSHRRGPRSIPGQGSSFLATIGLNTPRKTGKKQLFLRAGVERATSGCLFIQLQSSALPTELSKVVTLGGPRDKVKSGRSGRLCETGKRYGREAAVEET